MSSWKTLWVTAILATISTTGCTMDTGDENIDELDDSLRAIAQQREEEEPVLDESQQMFFAPSGFTVNVFNSFNDLPLWDQQNVTHFAGDSKPCDQVNNTRLRADDAASVDPVAQTVNVFPWRGSPFESAKGDSIHAVDDSVGGTPPTGALYWLPLDSVREPCNALQVDEHDLQQLHAFQSSQRGDLSEDTDWLWYIQASATSLGNLYNTTGSNYTWGGSSQSKGSFCYNYQTYKGVTNGGSGQRHNSSGNYYTNFYQGVYLWWVWLAHIATGSDYDFIRGWLNSCGQN